MKQSSENKHKSIPLQTIIIIMIIVGSVISFFLLYFMFQTSKSYGNMKDATQSYVDCQTAASNLRADSDNLTIHARGFVVTGEAEQAELYYSEVQTGNSQNRYLEELQDYLVDERAMQQLNTAMRLRDRLTVTEGYAMRLMVEAIGDDITEYPEKMQTIQLLPDDIRMSTNEKKDKARSLLFGSSYENSKNEVVSRINQGLDILMSDMLTNQMDSAQLLQRVLVRQQILCIALMIALLVQALFVFLMVILPLRRQIDGMTREQILDEKGASEVQFLARTYNHLFEQNQQANEALNFKATHDALTGLYNRTAYDSMREELAQSRENIALILADVDFFKSINDRYGHDIGDKTLKVVADILTASFRKEDMICRIGGDEFAIIMRRVDFSFKELVQYKMGRVAKALAHPEDGLPPTTLSVGIAFSDQQGEGMDLFKSADLALYHIKNRGRDGCAFSTASGEIEVM